MRYGGRRKRKKLKVTEAALTVRYETDIVRFKGIKYGEIRQEIE